MCMRFLFALITAAIALILTACQPKPLPMSPDEAARVDALTHNLSSRCMGRQLIDLPESFVLNSEDVNTIQGVRIKMMPMPKRVFDERLAVRWASLKAQRARYEPTPTPSLLEVRKLPDSAGMIFNRTEDQGVAAARTWELFAWRDGYFLLMTVAARDMRLYHDSFPGDTRETNVEEKYTLLMDTYARTRGRRDDEVPTQAGLCIANGFVAGPAREDEQINLAYHLKGSPDVFLDFNHFSSVHETKGLLARAADVERGLKASEALTIRKGERKLPGAHYEEWLAKGPTPEHVQGTLFSLHGDETGDSPAKPFTELRLFNGYRIPAPERSAEESAVLQDLTRATFSEAEAVAIWDRITASVRVRPGAF